MNTATHPAFPSGDQVRSQVLGQVVAQLRERAGLQQKEFAERIELAQSTVSRLERGQALVDWQLFSRTAGAFDMTPQELEQLVDDATKRANELADAMNGVATPPEPTPDDGGNEWWRTALLVAGAVGFVALIVLAVATVVREFEERRRRKERSDRG